MRKRPRRDQIAAILRDFKADLDAGLNIDQACRKAGIGPTTYYRWKARQEDPVSNEQLRVSELERENSSSVSIPAARMRANIVRAFERFGSLNILAISRSRCSMILKISR